MKKFLQYSLRKLDYFNQPVELTFNDDRRFGTYLGGILSLIIYILITLLISDSLSKLFNMFDPITRSSNIYFKEQPILNLTKFEMFYASYFMTRNFEILDDPTYFSYSISQFLVERKSDGNKKTSLNPLDILNCSVYKDFYKKKGLEKEYNGNNIEKGICFNTTGVKIGGDFVSEYFSNILYSIKKCKNDTDSNLICKSSQQINEVIKGGYFEFFYIEKNIDLKNYTNPFRDYLKSFFVLVDPNLKKFIDIYLKIIYISSDTGWIFTNENSTSDLSFDYFREQIESLENDDVLINFYLNSSNNTLYHSRIYVKLQEIAATIGGILKVFLFLGDLITYLPTQYEMYEYMINILFHYKEKEEHTKSLTYLDDEIKNSKNLRELGSVIKINKNNTAFEKIEKSKGERNLSQRNEINYLKKDYKAYDGRSLRLNQSHGQCSGPRYVINNLPIHLKKKNKQIESREEMNFNPNKSLYPNDSEVKFISKSNNMNLNFKLNSEVNIKEMKNSLKSSSFESNKANVKFDLNTKKNLGTKINELNAKLKQKFRLNIFSLFNIYVLRCCLKNSNRKYLFLNVALKKLNNYLDYLKIVQTLQEFNKLKKILFTKTQKKLFSAMSIPVIDDEKILKYNSKKNNGDEEPVKEYYEMYKSYCKIKIKADTTINKLNRKLVDNLDGDLKIIFDNLEKN